MINPLTKLLLINFLNQLLNYLIGVSSHNNNPLGLSVFHLLLYVYFEKMFNLGINIYPPCPVPISPQIESCGRGGRTNVMTAAS